jgi:hypothetical protein
MIQRMRKNSPGLGLLGHISVHVRVRLDERSDAPGVVVSPADGLVPAGPVADDVPGQDRRNERGLGRDQNVRRALLSRARRSAPDRSVACATDDTQPSDVTLPSLLHIALCDSEGLPRSAPSHPAGS